jgi:hypothetical protein
MIELTAQQQQALDETLREALEDERVQRGVRAVALRNAIRREDDQP